MSTLRKGSGGASVVFGVSGITFSGTIVQGYTKNKNSSVAETADESGETVAASFYDAKDEITIEGLVNGSPSAAPGDAVTINSDSCLVKSFEIMQGNTEFKKFRLVATKYANALS